MGPSVVGVHSRGRRDSRAARAVDCGGFCMAWRAAIRVLESEMGAGRVWWTTVVVDVVDEGSEDTPRARASMIITADDLLEHLEHIPPHRGHTDPCTHRRCAHN